MNKQTPDGSQRKKLIVFGGTGYVGQEVLRSALDKNIEVISVNRSAAPPTTQWSHLVSWLKGDAMKPAEFDKLFADAFAVISCVGAMGFGEHVKKINGQANVGLIQEAKKSGVPRFVLISAHDYPLASPILSNYYAGKAEAEKEFLATYADSGTIIKPAFIHGTRYILGGIPLPLWLVGSPAEYVFSMGLFRLIERLPVVGKSLGPMFAPPVSVRDVGRTAIISAIRAEYSGEISAYKIADIAARFSEY
eukprot:TRINITY_DN10095_c0_g1_i1.p1 TRINITY_DN10095_c0_g1~~TRINITY_DN10095_c0_g1_i1.p1  ORF type:complete len:249 (+),score=73.28 TRINITY_DN10095_c0_g1_i1:56-802(+)